MTASLKRIFIRWAAGGLYLMRMRMESSSQARIDAVTGEVFTGYSVPAGLPDRWYGMPDGSGSAAGQVVND